MRNYKIFICLFLFLLVQSPGYTKVEEPTRGTYEEFIRMPFGVRSKENLNYLPVVDPEGEPFDWYRFPKYVIGVIGGPEEPLITPEGFIQTDFGTLKFYTGEDLKPINKRIKTLRKGYLPIVEMHLKRDKIDYYFEYFADIVEGVKKVKYKHAFGIPNKILDTKIDNLISFVRIKISNNSRENRNVRFGVGLGSEKLPIHKKDDPSFKRGPSIPSQLKFDNQIKSLTGEGRLLYTLSQLPDTVIGSKGTDKGIIQYSFALLPDESQELIVKMPYFVGVKEDVTPISKAFYVKHLNNTIDFWEKLLDEKSTKIKVPEIKIVNTYKSNLIYSLIGCLDIIDGNYFYHANSNVYDAFWLRDGSLNLRGLDLAGFHDEVENCLYIYLEWQEENGEFVGRHVHQWDGHGQAMWALGHHYLVTRNMKYAEKVFPSVKKAMEWQWNFRKEAWDEAEGLLPYLYMGDNEGVKGHLVGYNLWAISGAKGSSWLAEGLRDDKLAERWIKRYKEYEDILLKKCKEVYDKLGVVPPALEGLEAPSIRKGWYGDVYGIDWGNLMLVYPSGVFDPYDNMVSGSLKEWRKKTFEGIFGYPRNGIESFLHSYTPLYISETYVRRGNEWEANRDLYNHLVHTSATNMASEGMDASMRWGWKESNWTIPHGEFAGKYLSFIRDMLVLELDGDLHIGRALSPAWLKEGEEIEFSGPTFFGEMGVKIDVLKDGILLNIEPPTRNPPESIYIDVPQNYEIVSVIKDGKSYSNFSKDKVILPAFMKESSIRIRWSKIMDAPPLSYKRAVMDYQANYKKMVQNPKISLVVGSLKVSATEVDSNEFFTVSAIVRNDGGAGWLNQNINLFVDGEVIKSNPKELSRGIGFTSPEDIISFRRNQEGQVRISFPLKLDPGTHHVSIGIGNDTLSSKKVTVGEFAP